MKKWCVYIVDNYIQSAHILANLPDKLTELAKINKNTTLELLRAWGRGEKTVGILWNEAIDVWLIMKKSSFSN